jgi:hypothetical protein
MFQELRPTKYTAKWRLCFCRKSFKAMSPDEVVEEVKNQDFVVVVELVSLLE